MRRLGIGIMLAGLNWQASFAQESTLAFECRFENLGTVVNYQAIESDDGERILKYQYGSRASEKASTLPLDHVELELTGSFDPTLQAQDAYDVRNYSEHWKTISIRAGNYFYMLDVDADGEAVLRVRVGSVDSDPIFEENCLVAHNDIYAKLMIGMPNWYYVLDDKVKGWIEWELIY